MAERTYTPDEWAYISEQGLTPGDDIEEALFQRRERDGMGLPATMAVEGRRVSVLLIDERQWNPWIWVEWIAGGVVLKDIESGCYVFIPFHRIDRIMWNPWTERDSTTHALPFLADTMDQLNALTVRPKDGE